MADFGQIDLKWENHKICISGLKNHARTILKKPTES